MSDALDATLHAGGHHVITTPFFHDMRHTLCDRRPVGLGRSHIMFLHLLAG